MPRRSIGALEIGLERGLSRRSLQRPGAQPAARGGSAAHEVRSRDELRAASPVCYLAVYFPRETRLKSFGWLMSVWLTIVRKLGLVVR